MKITHVRISVLESGPGYNNSSCTLEAVLDDGEDYAEVAKELRAMCKSEIKGEKEIMRIWESVENMRYELKANEDSLQRQRAEIKANRDLIRAHGRLGDIAKREDIDTPLFDDIPF